MRNELSTAIPFLILVLLFACSKSSPIVPPVSKQELHFLNQGAVVPHPLSTLAIFVPDSLRFSSIQDSQIVNSWTAQIASEDFSKLLSIIEDNNLIGIPDPVLPPGSQMCGGHRGMTIYIEIDGLADTLDIPGILWCKQNRSLWPSGLESLVQVSDSLVIHYTP